MLSITQGTPQPNCSGTSRRTALKAGFLGCAGLSLADLLRMNALGNPAETKKSVILIWLDGGPSQLETYDPKPMAPAEYRGPFGALNTNVPGMIVSETLPLHCQHADKMIFVRSLHHGTGDHFAGAHWMLTGRAGSNSVNKAQMYPSVGSYVSRVKGANSAGMPAYVGLPAAQSVYLYPGYQGAAYLGNTYGPFQVNMKQKYLASSYKSPIQPPEFLSAGAKLEPARSTERQTLLGQLDGLRREIDQSGMMESMDHFQQKAVELVTSNKAREAFDMSGETPETLARYGKGPWGYYTLMARRLVEAGVSFVTVDMPHWDNHSKIEEGHGTKLVKVDHAVSALLEDLQDRRMLDDVLVVVMGEFGRTPKLNSGQPGIPIPGRDHWGNAISAMLAGGGLRGGQIIGETNSKAEHPVSRPLKPGHLLATIYKVLGIDPSLSFLNHSGRPIPILDEGEPIAEAFS